MIGVYLPGLRDLSGQGQLVREIDIVGLATKRIGEALSAPSALARPLRIPGFVEVQRVRTTWYTLIRFRSRRLIAVSRQELAPTHFGDYTGSEVSVFFQPAPARRQRAAAAPGSG